MTNSDEPAGAVIGARPGGLTAANARRWHGVPVVVLTTADAGLPAAQRDAGAGRIGVG